MKRFRAIQWLLRLDGYEKLFFVLTTIQAGVVWRHRSFPTQDGPMQIYLADVFEHLMRRTGEYGSYFQIQGYLHPYSFSLYALVLLNQLFAPLTSERILVFAYFIGFSLGARFLIRSIDAENHWLPLFFLPFAFNAYLCLGIYNFSCGVALLMFLMGLWRRWSGEWTAVRSLGWLALLMLLAVMHHVPLLILGVFLAAHAAVQGLLFLRSAGRGSGALRALWRRMRGDLAHAALLAAPLGWYMIFAMTAVRGEVTTVPAMAMSWADRIRGLMQMLPLSPYLAPGYCFLLLVIVVAPTALLSLRPKLSLPPKSAAIASAPLAAAAITCLAVYVFGPHFLFGHGHGYFAERMAVPFVICFLAAQAPLRIPAVLQRMAAVLLAGVFLFMSSVRERETTMMVAELAPLYDAQPMYRGSSGAIVSGIEPLAGYNFNPYYWAGALYAQKGKGILLNASGSYEPIGLFGVREAHPWDDHTSPQQIREVLLNRRAAASPDIAFLCGGKWDSSQAEIGPSAILAQRSALTPALDSRVYYCYAGGADGAIQQAQGRKNDRSMASAITGR